MGIRRNIATSTASVDEQKKSFISIKYFMLPAKLAYFLNYARYSFTEYIILFLVAAGFTSSSAGQLAGFQLIGGLLAAPIWTYIADRKHLHRFLAVGVCLLSVLLAGAQPFLTETLGNENKTVCPHVMTSHLEGHGNEWNSTNKHKNLFLILLILTFIFASFDSSIVSFVDAGVIRRIRANQSKCDYGNQRFYGCLGYIVGSLLMSTSINYFPQGKVSCYVGIFFVYGIFSLLLALCNYWMYTGIDTEELEGIQIVHHFKQIVKSLKKSECVILFSTVFVNGISQGVWFSYIFLFMKEMNAPTLLLGTSTAVSGLSGALFFSVSTTLISWLGGPIHSLALACCVWTLRFITAVHVKSPYLILLIDITQGLTFSLSGAASIEYIKTKIDPQIAASIFGINTFANTFGLIIANVGGGLIYTAYGARTLYLCSAVLSSIWSILIILFIFFKIRY